MKPEPNPKQTKEVKPYTNPKQAKTKPKEAKPWTKPNQTRVKKPTPKLLGFAPYLRQRSCFSPGIEAFETHIFWLKRSQTLPPLSCIFVFHWKVIVPFGIIEAWGDPFAYLYFTL